MYLLGNDSVIGGIPTTTQVSLLESRTAEAIKGKRMVLFLGVDAIWALSANVANIINK